MTDIYVGNTDNDWFDFLAGLSGVDEVNFWKPSPSGFRAIGEGDAFAFRLKAPRNRIGGFGTFVRSSALPISLAWDAFGVKNGVASLSDFVRAIARYRTGETVSPSTFIVCRVLVEPVFLPPERWFEPPASWSPSIMQGKTFRAGTEESAALGASLAAAAGRMPAAGLADMDQARFGAPVSVAPRLGQGAFRVAVTELYGRQCALTEGKVLPALDAAHIRPYAEGGAHVLCNGILLRKDIHSVFDAGYATLDADYRFVVSDKVRDVFHNGNEYRRLHGARIRLPDAPAHRPSADSLRWHNENRYLG